MPLYFGLSSQELPLTVDSIGNRWAQERVQRPNGYPHYHWLQTEQSVGEVIINEKKLLLPKGTGILLAPFVPHTYYPKQERWTTSFVTFAGRLETEIGKIVGHEPYILVKDSADFSFQDWTDSMIISHEAQQIDPVRLSIDCYAFLININRFCDYQDFLLQPLYQRYVAPAIKEIETNYHLEITVQGLSSSVYVSPQYLSRLFKRFLGCSTYAYLTNYRLNKAKELLAGRPDLEIQQVSFRVGYHDASHFIALFKNAAGCTPLEFRRLHH